MPRVQRRSTATVTSLDLGEVQQKAQEYILSRAGKADFESRADAAKKELSSYVDRHGEVDEKGSRWVKLRTPVVVKGKKYSWLKRQASTSKSLVIPKAERVLRELGLYDQCCEQVITLPPEHAESVLAALRATAPAIADLLTVEKYLSQDLIQRVKMTTPTFTDDNYDRMFVEETKYSFVTPEAGPSDG